MFWRGCRGGGGRPQTRSSGQRSGGWRSGWRATARRGGLILRRSCFVSRRARRGPVLQTIRWILLSTRCLQRRPAASSPLEKPEDRAASEEGADGQDPVADAQSRRGHQRQTTAVLVVGVPVILGGRRKTDHRSDYYPDWCWAQRHPGAGLLRNWERTRYDTRPIRNRYGYDTITSLIRKR